MRLRLAGALLVGLLASCASGGPPSTTTTPDRVSLGWDGSVRLVTFPDGTRCAIYTAGDHGGIDCDWPER